MNHSGNDPRAPQTGQTLVQGGQPQYVAASPPGVAVALPNSSSTGQQPTPAPGSQQGHGQYPQAQQPQYAQQPQPQAKAPDRGDELIAGAGKTLYEFRGEHSEEARSGGRHKTFFADDTNLASISLNEDRQHSNLAGGGSTTWILVGLVVAVVGGLTAFFVYSGAGKDVDEPVDEVADVEVAPAEAAPAEVAPVPGEGALAEAGAPAAADAGTPPAEPAEPAEPTEPADQAKPAEDPAPEPAPKKKSSSTKKKSSSTTKKKSEPARKVPAIAPSKPPRDSSLDGLPSPD